MAITPADRQIRQYVGRRWRLPLGDARITRRLRTSHRLYRRTLAHDIDIDIDIGNASATRCRHALNTR
jgi:hypothetical protein